MKIVFVQKSFYDSKDSLFKDYPLETLTYEKIKRGVSTFRYEDRYDPHYAGGRRRKIGMTSWSRFSTLIGEILQEVWYEVAVMVINQNYDGWLLDALEDWYIAHGPQRHLSGYSDAAKKKEAVQSAIWATTTKLYDSEDWVNYIPFNRIHRPNVLQGKEFLTVLTECCKKPGQIPEKLHHYDSKYYCPHCGRWSPAEIVKRAPLED